MSALNILGCSFLLCHFGYSIPATAALGARDILSGSCDFTHRGNQVSPRKLHMHLHLVRGQSERPRQAVCRDFLARWGLPTLPATSGSSLCHPSRDATPVSPSIPPSDSWCLTLPYAETARGALLPHRIRCKVQACHSLSSARNSSPSISPAVVA